MPRTCTICLHPDRAEIDRALVERQPFRNIAERFATSSAALFRHKQHLPAYIAKAHEAREAAQAEGLLGQVQGLQGRALDVLAAAEEAGDLRAATAAIREARGCLELLGRVTGELVQVQKHAHLHLEQRGPATEMDDFLPEERETIMRIAHRRLLRRGRDGPGTDLGGQP